MEGLIIFSLLVFLLVLSGAISRIYYDNKIDEVKAELESEVNKNKLNNNSNEETMKSYITVQCDKAFSYLSRKRVIKKYIGIFGILFGIMACILTGLAIHFTKNTDTVSDILQVLNNNKILTETEYNRISAKISINNLFSSGILLYSGLSQVFLLSIVVYDLFLPDKEYTNLRRELDRISSKL